VTTFYELPLSGAPQSYTITLPVSGKTEGITFFLVFQYRDASPAIYGGGGWVLDIYDQNGLPMLCGVPLVTGANLLAPFDYLSLGGGLGVYSEGIPDAVPTFDNLGSGSHVIWFTEP